MNTRLIKGLLDLVETFERQNPDGDMPTFLAWAQARVAPPPAAPPVLDVLKTQQLPIGDPQQQYYDPGVPVLQTYVSHGITKAFRFFRVYVKHAFDGQTPLSFDEFISLAYLALGGNMTKTELVEITINEKTSGMLVLNRLIAQGLIEQFDDPTDKRMRRLAITPLGLETLRAAQPAMNQATGLLTGDLTVDEQRLLASLLTRLDQFHEPIYRLHLQNKDLNLEQLAQASEEKDR